MCVEFMALIAIYGVTLATGFATIFIGGYKLRDTGETLCERGDLVAEINEQVTRFDTVSVTPDDNR